MWLDSVAGFGVSYYTITNCLYLLEYTYYPHYSYTYYPHQVGVWLDAVAEFVLETDG